MLLPELLSVALAATPVPKPFTAGPSIEGISEYGLPNGLKVLFVRDESKPTVTVNLTVAWRTSSSTWCSRAPPRHPTRRRR